MDIKLLVKEYPNPNDLPSSLSNGLIPLNEKFTKIDPNILDVVKDTIKDFENKTHLLKELYQELLKKESFVITVYITQGFPGPYDAWFIESESAIVFNVSLWDIKSLKNEAEILLKHEVSHFIFHKMCPTPYNKEIILTDDCELLKAVKYHVIDEGIAHFVANFSKIDDLLSSRQDKKEEANRELNAFLLSIESGELSSKEKEVQLHKAFTGPYWDKYGDISGLFKIYDLYRKSGPSSITHLIQDCAYNTKKQSYYIRDF